MNVLEKLYAETDFRQWQDSRGFTQINAGNVNKYYVVYQKDKLCKGKLCQQCSGMYSSFNDENDILKDRIVPKRCLTYEEEKKQSSILSVSGNLLGKLKVPARYLNTLWSTLDLVPQQAKEEMQEYITNFPNNNPPGLYIHSTVNESGKTSCLWLLLHGLLYNRKIAQSYVFMKMGAFVEKLREDSLEPEPVFLKHVINCSVLILDDLGRENSTKFTEEKIYSILDRRLDLGLPYIITSNLPLNESVWIKDINKAILTRIKAGCQIIELLTPQPDDEGIQ